MPITSILQYVRQATNRFVGAKDGNVAMIFALSALPLFAFIGSAIDYSRFNAARTAMQSAIDSTALMVSKDLASGKITESQINAAAQTYFHALYVYPEAQNVTINAVFTANNSTPENGNLGSTIELQGSGQISTDFMKIFGFSTLSFGASTTTAWGQSRLRVSLVLDNTGSMSSSGKITALISAVNGNGGFIDQLAGLSTQPGDVLVSVVPFARTVQVKANNDSNFNYSADWLDWTDWLAPPTDQHALSYGAYGNGGTKPALPKNWHNIGPGAACPFSGNFKCTTGPANGSSNATSIPSSGTYSGYICPSVDSFFNAYYNGCWTSEPVKNSDGSAKIDTFCSGDSSCACATSSNCTCSGSGSSKSCKGPLYAHNWTQPGPNDTAHNLNQPRVSSIVGFSSVPPGDANYPDYQWNSNAAKQYLVPNDYQGQSTNPLSTWTNCVTDRDQPYDSNAATYDTTVADAATQTPPSASSRFPAIQDHQGGGLYCGPNASTKLQEVVGVKDVGTAAEKQALKDFVNTMKPTGNTNQSIGLDWGMQTLVTENSPFPAPDEDPRYTYNRIIILLTDGANTENRWYSTQSSIDTRQKKLCDSIKGEIDPKTNRPMYTIYAIQVATDGAATQSVLTYCATTPTLSQPGPFFFRLTNSADIAGTFKDIGNQLAPLRLAN